MGRIDSSNTHMLLQPVHGPEPLMLGHNNYGHGNMVNITLFPHLSLLNVFQVCKHIHLKNHIFSFLKLHFRRFSIRITTIIMKREVDKLSFK